MATMTSARNIVCRSGASVSTSRARCVPVRAMSDKLVQKPEMKRPEAPSPGAAAAATAPQPVPQPTSTPSSSSGITIEYQRARAKEMTKYFKELKLNEQIVKSTGLGWTKANEISNGRWVMFGLLVGMLTEYATGVDFPEQLKLMCSYLGIVDVE